jgi:hypothetical protein
MRAGRPRWLCTLTCRRVKYNSDLALSLAWLAGCPCSFVTCAWWTPPPVRHGPQYSFDATAWCASRLHRATVLVSAASKSALQVLMLPPISAMLMRNRCGQCAQILLPHRYL